MSLLLVPLDGRLSLKGFLGSGGMGEVHRAWDAGLERAVAVKFLRSSDPREADRLLLEARLQARVEHPNVVRVHDTGTLEGRPCLVLQLVEGRTLADLATETDWRGLVAVAIQAARGLAAAHQEGLVHRDVKPANILVEEAAGASIARLSDFGLARGEEGGLTRSGLLMGTVDFMAPEQILGLGPVDFRADIYGLGATLYACLAGRPPFRSGTPPTGAGPGGARSQASTEGESPSPAELLNRILEREAPPLDHRRSGMPRDLAVVVAKAMEKDPGRRYTSADLFADDLERVLRGEPILARPTGWLVRGLRWVRRNPVAARSLAASLLVVAGAAAYGLWRSRQATLETLNAARLGGEAKALELKLRMAHLSPPHDLRPVRAALEEGIRRLAAHRGPGAAAADMARGKVLYLLGRTEDARLALESARAHGYRGQDLEEALGLAYARLYRQAQREAQGVRDPELRSERLRRVKADYQEPAARHLRASGGGVYAQAVLALSEDDYPRSRELARRARAEDPERLEATLIELEALYIEGNQAVDGMDRPKVRELVEQGRALGRQLAEALRSDPEVLRDLAHLEGLAANLDQNEGRDPSAHVAAGLAYLDRACALDPDQVETWLVQGDLLEIAANADSSAGGARALDLSQRQVEVARRALALAPGRPASLIRLSKALYSLGHAKTFHALDPTADLAEGRRAGLEAAGLEPWNTQGLHVAALNAVDEARYRLVHGSDPSEALTAGQASLERLQGVKGLHPRLVTPIWADLLTLKAQWVWNQGGHPDPLQQEALARQEALVKEDPGRLNATTDVGYMAILWAQSRVLWGGSVQEILGRVEPVLAAGSARWPGQPLLAYYEAFLRALRLFDSPGGRPAALDRQLVRDAEAAYRRMWKVLPNPQVVEIRAWAHLARAEAGEPGEAARACADFEAMLRLDPSATAMTGGLVRALRVRPGGGHLARALRILDGLPEEAQRDAEVQLMRAALLRSLGRGAEADVLQKQALAHQPLLAGHPLLRP